MDLIYLDFLQQRQKNIRELPEFGLKPNIQKRPNVGNLDQINSD